MRVCVCVSPRPRDGTPQPPADSGAVPPFITITPAQGIATQGGVDRRKVVHNTTAHQSERQRPCHTNAGAKTSFDVTYHPLQPHLLDGTLIQCQIPGGRSYTIELTGRSSRPLVEFSFHHHDFGPCFVRPDISGGSPSLPPIEHPADEGAVTKELVITNKDEEQDCTIATDFA